MIEVCEKLILMKLHGMAEGLREQLNVSPTDLGLENASASSSTRKALPGICA
jgi:hypothetical protein